MALFSFRLILQYFLSFLIDLMALFSFRLILQYFLSFLIDLIPSLKLTLYIKVDPNDLVGDMYIFPWGQIDYFFHHAYES